MPGSFFYCGLQIILIAIKILIGIKGDVSMKTIQQLAYLTIGVYREYLDRGLSVEEAEQKTVREIVENNEDVELIRINTHARELKMIKTLAEEQKDQ